MDEHFEEIVKEAMEEMLGFEEEIFTTEDLEFIANELNDDDFIDWKILSYRNTLYAHYDTSEKNGVGATFYICPEQNEISKEDFIDIMLKIENEYQAIQNQKG